MRSLTRASFVRLRTAQYVQDNVETVFRDYSLFVVNRDNQYALYRILYRLRAARVGHAGLLVKETKKEAWASSVVQYG